MKLLNDLHFSIKQFINRDRDLAELFDKATMGVFWPITITFMMTLLVSSLEFSLLNSETDSVGFLRPGFTAISIRSEYKTSGRLDINFQNFKRLTQLDEDITTLFTAETNMEFTSLNAVDKKLLKNSVSVLLTTDAFFKASAGKVISGRTFNNNDMQSGRSVAVITSGLAKKLWGDKDKYSKSIYIQGRIVDLIGNWEFESDTTSENQTLILPISLASLVSNDAFNSVSKFIIKGDDSEALNMLKNSFDQIQLDSNRPIDRPEYRIIVPNSSGKNGILWKLKKVPAEFACILISIFALIFAAMNWDRALAQCPDVLAWRKWILNDSVKVRNDLFYQFMKNYFIWIFISFILAKFLVMIFYSLYRADLYFAFEINFSSILILFIIPLTVLWVTDMRVRKEIKLVRWI